MMSAADDFDYASTTVQTHTHPCHVHECNMFASARRSPMQHVYQCKAPINAKCLLVHEVCPLALDCAEGSVPLQGIAAADKV